MSNAVIGYLFGVVSGFGLGALVGVGVERWRKRAAPSDGGER